MMNRINRCHMLQTIAASTLIGAAGAPASAQTTGSYIPSLQDVSRAVQTELRAAPEVSSPMIDISNNKGVVTLTGTVPTLLDKHRAAEVAQTVRGVRAVVNRLDVSSAHRPDDAIASDIVQALAADPAADAYELSVRVDDGIAYLAGNVESWHERDLAGKVARSVRGVKGVMTDEIEMDLTINRPDTEILADARSRLRWDRWVDDQSINVEVDDGRVTLRGSVGSAAEKRRAMTTAWVGGVTGVDESSLEVEPWIRDPVKRAPIDAARLPDSEIAGAVDAAMFYDPRVLGEAVNVSCDAGIVTLTGKVDNLRAKHAAEQDAKNTVGVWRVRNFVTVRPSAAIPDGDRLRDRVLDTIERDPIVWRDEKFVRADNGTVYLMGDARSPAEADRAVEIVSAVPGVVEVIDQLDTKSNWDWMPDQELTEDVEAQLFWSPFVDSDDIAVETDNGVVTLTGEVDDWAEMAAARENAWDADPKAVRLDLYITGS